jgi:hypothetical protein
VRPEHWGQASPAGGQRRRVPGGTKARREYSAGRGRSEAPRTPGGAGPGSEPEEPSPPAPRAPQAGRPEPQRQPEACSQSVGSADQPSPEADGGGTSGAPGAAAWRLPQGPKQQQQRAGPEARQAPSSPAARPRRAAEPGEPRPPREQRAAGPQPAVQPAEAARGVEAPERQPPGLQAGPPLQQEGQEAIQQQAENLVPSRRLRVWRGACGAPVPLPRQQSWNAFSFLLRHTPRAYRG